MALHDSLPSSMDPDLKALAEMICHQSEDLREKIRDLKEKIAEQNQDLRERLDVQTEDLRERIQDLKDNINKNEAEIKEINKEHHAHVVDLTAVKTAAQLEARHTSSKIAALTGIGSSIVVAAFIKFFGL